MAFSREEVAEYIASHLVIKGHYDNSINAFLVDIFIHNNYVKYNIRNRDMISVELFCVVVEALFGRYYSRADVSYIQLAMDIGLSPLFVFTLIMPYFMRIINTIMHNNGADVAVFDPHEGSTYYLSFTGLRSRLKALLAMDDFCKPFSFVVWDEFVKAMDGVFSRFRHLGSDGLEYDLDALKREIVDDWWGVRGKWRAKLRETGLRLKEELAAAVFDPERVWRFSQAQSMYAWEWLDCYS